MIQIDPSYRPAPIEHKQVFGVTFEQGRQELPIDDALIANFVTEKKDVPESAKRDMKIALIILKYTQSNSVCYVKDGQAIGIGAGQQSRVHCTRLRDRRRTTGFFASVRRSWHFRFLIKSHVPSVTMRSTFTSETNRRMYSQMAHGRRCLPSSRRHLPPKEKRGMA